MKKFSNYIKNKELQDLLDAGYSLQEALLMIGMRPPGEDPEGNPIGLHPGVPEGTIFSSYANEKIEADIAKSFGFESKTNGFGIKKVNGKPDNTAVFGDAYYCCQGPLGSDPVGALERSRYVVVPFSETSFSTSGTTWIVAKKFGGEWMGTHFLNKYNPNNSIETKWLTPKKMGVATDTPLKLFDILKTVSKSIENHRLLTSEVKDRLKACLLLVNDYTGTTSFKGGKSQAKLPNKHKTTTIPLGTLNLTSSELATISKDFGEILCAVWACNNIKYQRVKFPSAEGEALVDFYGYPYANDLTFEMPVSVKSGSGASTTMANLTDHLIKKMKNTKFKASFSKDEQDVIDNYLYIISNSDVMTGILQMHKTLDTDAYRALCDAPGMPADPSVSSLENWLADPSRQTTKKGKTISDKVKTQKDLEAFYKENGSKPDGASWSKFEKGTLKRQVGVIIGPLGMALIGKMNESELIRGTLTKAARTIVLLQMNVDVKSSSISIKRGEFKDFMFHFSWGGGTTNPHRNKFGFKAETFK